ncbi:M15 family metallopeptidase [Indiicoccus explosivorum]|uniref:M15 family metallopeptidase n=1 Tax=Indiicoccus explosivorum TaxID=1917864 RepID=UPI000B436E71|nr:M15 family metallopeptidase [Indiicoccus explosivorum]
MAQRYQKKAPKKRSVYIWSTVVVVLIAAAGGAGIWLGVYTAQEQAVLTGRAVTEPEEDETSPLEHEAPAVPEEDGQEPEPVLEKEEPAEPEPEEPAVPEPPVQEPAGTDEPAPAEEPEQPVDRRAYPAEIILPDEPTVINGILLANKQHPLPADYAPGESAEARAAFEKMAAAAAEEGIQLVAFSTFRTFERQQELYEGYAAKDGQAAADRYSARPGHSEHQTGLAFDIGEAGQEQHWASATFADTPGGKWLAENAHRFGFILRYPAGEEKTTGYMYEAWHFRYVGKEAAEAIHEQGVTLEEYLGVGSK